MRLSCHFEEECGFIFNCKLFSFKDGIHLKVGAGMEELKFTTLQ